MVDFDAFSGGIDNGSPRSMLGIKVLICYTLASVKVPVGRQNFCEFLQKEGYVNYFASNEALDELIRDGMVAALDFHNVDSVTVTPEGELNAHTLENEIYSSVREGVVKGALKLVARERTERENTVNIEKVENGYEVTFIIRNGDDVLMSLSLGVPDAPQAEQLKEGFLNSSSQLYSDIIERLIGEK